MAPSSSAPESPPAVLRRVQYEDLRLLIEAAPPGAAYRASIVESPGGESQPSDPIHWTSPIDAPTREGDVQRVGASLFDAFVTGEIRELYRESLALASARGNGLRVKLLIDPPELCGAPWELLYDARNRRYLGLSSKTPIVRHSRIAQAAEPLSIEPPLRVLGLVASPIDLPRLDVDRERALIDEALAAAIKAGLVELSWVQGGTWQDLQEAMRQNWHVFHFCGHGDYDAQAGEGYLILEEAGGRAQRLAASRLGLLLREEGDVRLAVLNSCKGAAGDTSASSSSVAGALMRTGIGGVVAMQNPISDQAALTFARVTYLAIAKGLPLEAAIGSARVAMALEHAKPIEWWTPVLHMRASDGALFTVPSTPTAKDANIPGSEYLGPDLDRRLEKTLARRRRQRQLLYAWLLAPIPVLGVLVGTRVSTDTVRADIEASGVRVVLSSQSELFGEQPRLQSFRATNFRQVLLPGAVFPVRPSPAQPAEVSAIAADAGSWISLQPWSLPAGSSVAWDHPRGALGGEYALSVAPGADQRFHVGLVHRIALSRFGLPAERRDYGGNSVLEIGTADTSLNLDAQLLQPAGFTLPSMTIDSIEMVRRGFGDAGPFAESTVLRANLHFDGRDTLIESTHLRLGGIHAALMKFRLIDRGVAFTVDGSLREVVIGRKNQALPSRLRWLIREQPSYLGLAALAYVLILVTLVIGWRANHASRATTN